MDVRLFCTIVITTMSGACITAHAPCTYKSERDVYIEVLLARARRSQVRTGTLLEVFPVCFKQSVCELITLTRIETRQVCTLFLLFTGVIQGYIDQNIYLYCNYMTWLLLQLRFLYLTYSCISL